MKKDAISFINITPLLPVLLRTATATGTEKDLGASMPQQVAALLDVKCTGSDADETLDAKVQGSNDGGTTWADIVSFTQVLQTAGAAIERKNITVNYRSYRAIGTQAGTTPSFTFGVYLIGAQPTYAPVTQVD